MRIGKALLLCSILVTGALYAQEKAPAGGLDTALVERLTGAKGSLDAAAGVFKVSVPRNDLAVQVGGVRMHPRLGLTSWAAFQQTGQGVMVLQETQVNPVMSVALDAGLEVTALHNHFFGDELKIMFIHIGGHGSGGEAGVGSWTRSGLRSSMTSMSGGAESTFSIRSLESSASCGGSSAART